jgi:hypothetical protein
MAWLRAYSLAIKIQLISSREKIAISLALRARIQKKQAP